ncbi:hypothetical protein Zmor_019234 [Zophobas morio]|uniref:Hexosyltransferase n=1 Tax=Zophobas morio TaxID=2755281 RepID=A0AA38HZV1_9CUCU|nr:hypothetical protein Zmor_019234 [Zophobas morio]
MRFGPARIWFRRLCFIFSCVAIIDLLMIWNSSLTDGLSPVEGWDEGVSRNVSDYVNELFKPRILPESFCQDEKILMVMVCSRPDGFEIRRAIRDTWGQKHTNASVFFLVGEVKSRRLQNKLEAESEEFADIIQERFVDTYNNLTLKSVHMLKVFKIYCADTYKYLMKVDDDLYFNLDATVTHLQHRPYQRNTLIGRVRSQTAPYRGSSSKWYMPYKWYPDSIYPDFLCGPGYLMSADVVDKLFKCSLEVPLLHTEDVYLTGICSKYMGIKLTNNYRFTCNKNDSHVCLDPKAWTRHYYTAATIRETYFILKNNGCEKLKRYSVLMAWIFFLRHF